jgi:hypothetical protein
MERQGSPLTENLEERVRGRAGSGARRGNPADVAAAIVGETFESAADTLRGTLPQEGRIAGAAGALADRLESSGHYLQEQGLTGAIDELESLIRRYPIQALLLSAGLGYALSRLRRR